MDGAPGGPQSHPGHCYRQQKYQRCHQVPNPTVPPTACRFNDWSTRLKYNPSTWVNIVKWSTMEVEKLKISKILDPSAGQEVKTVGRAGAAND